MKKIIKYIIIVTVVCFVVAVLSVPFSMFFMVLKEGFKDESQSPSNITQQAINTRNISLCDTIKNPLAGLSGTTEEMSISRCYEDYVKIHPDKNACDGLVHDTQYCRIILAEITKDPLVCNDYPYCVGRVANIEKDATICKIIKDSIKQKECTDYVK